MTSTSLSSSGSFLKFYIASLHLFSILFYWDKDENKTNEQFFFTTPIDSVFLNCIIMCSPCTKVVGRLTLKTNLEEASLALFSYHKNTDSWYKYSCQKHLWLPSSPLLNCATNWFYPPKNSKYDRKKLFIIEGIWEVLAKDGSSLS